MQQLACEPMRKESTRSRATAILQFIHSDLCSEIRLTSLGGNFYFISFADDFSRYTWFFFMNQKSEALKFFKHFKATVKLLIQTKICAFRSDRGGEFISLAFSAFFQESRIHRELTQAYTPHQNRISQSKNRTLLEKSRAMVFDAHTPYYLWSEAINTANYLTNRSPTRANLGVSPYQRLFGHPPNQQHLRVYACVAFVHVPKEKRVKLDAYNIKSIFVDYSDETKGYRFHNPVSCIITISGEIKFAEYHFWHTPKDSSTTPAVTLESLPDRSAVIELVNPVFVTDILT
jgi:hypothetical protein